MMQNPLKIKKLAYLEMAGDLEHFSPLLKSFGFVGNDKGDFFQNEIYLKYHQGRDDFVKLHKNGFSTIALYVEDKSFAMHKALERGAQKGSSDDAICGIGDCEILFLEEKDLPRFHGQEGHLKRIDHIAFNIYRKSEEASFHFMQDILGFTPQKNFKIKGKTTSFETKSFRLDEAELCFVLSRSDDPTSQISDFLNMFRGEGIQHLAFEVKDIYDSIKQLQMQDIDFQPTPAAYYDDLPNRISSHGQDIARLKEAGVLIDGDDQRHDYLMQIFTKSLLGPIFFELIERRGEKGLGENNITALFKSVEQAASEHILSRN